MMVHKMDLQGIAVIAIYVSDLDAAKAFYIDLLGFTDKGPMGPGLILEFDGMSFYIEPGREKNAENIEMKRADITVTFQVESVKAAFDSLKAKEIIFAMDYTEYSADFAMFMFADPDGNILEIAGKP